MRVLYLFNLICYFSFPKLIFFLLVFLFVYPVFHWFSPDVWCIPWGGKFNFSSSQFDENDFSWGGKFNFTSSRFHENEFPWGGKFHFSSPKFRENELPSVGKFQFSSSKFHHNDLSLGGNFFLSASKCLESVSKFCFLSIKVGGHWRWSPGGAQHLNFLKLLSWFKKRILLPSQSWIQLRVR